MLFLAGVVMLGLGVAATIASGGNTPGTFTPANVALAGAVLSLLILPAERSVRR